MPNAAPHPVRIRPRVRDCDRKRAARACWRCRDRKSRCIITPGERARGDKCQRCTRNDWQCVFSDIPYATNAANEEATLGSRQDDSGLTGATNSPSLSPRLSEMTRFQGPPTNRRARRWSTDTAQLVVKNPHQTHFLGEVSNGQFISKVQDAVVADSPVEAKKELPSEYMQSLDSNGTDLELLKISLEGFPPRNVADFLVTTFFSVSEANYYYMDRERFKERLNRCYDEMTPESVDNSASFVCLALMVFAMGSQFAGLKAPSRMIPAMNMSKHGPGMVFYAKAKLLVADVITQCSLESIQVCFLIGLFLLPSNISDLSYVYHGMALKMAISAGLHRRIVNPSLDHRVMHVRNRLWWSLYASERRLTIILGRPESIRREDIDAPLPEFCEDLDLPRSADNLYNLQQSIPLTMIYNRAVRLGKSMNFTDSEADSKVQEIQTELSRWLAQIPTELQLSNLDPTKKPFRGAVHLHFTWNQITIYMGRAALLRRIQRYLHQLRDSREGRNGFNDDNPPRPHESSSSRDDAEARLSRDCVAAAYRIVDLIRYLHDMGKLARFSFTDMNCCSTAAIIVIIHEIVRRHPLFNTSMSAILQAMRFMASGCENARHALTMVQNLLAMTTAIKNKYPEPPTEGADDTPSSRDDAGPQSGPTAGYEQWETWMAESENWAISSRKLSDASRLAMSWGEAADWPVDNPATYAPAQAAAQGSFAPLADNAMSEVGIPSGFVYNGPQDLTSLGLSGFGGLDFLNM